MKIKEIPEDFIVKEISNVKLLDKGAYSVYNLKKKNYNTEKAVQRIADKSDIKRKLIGYAGNKDRNAITEQSISIKNKKINIKLNDIELNFLGYSDKPISLGDLVGNEFIIVVKELNKENIKNLRNKLKNKKILVPNYFGEQRFSRNNVKIGKLIIKKDFKGAVELLKKDKEFHNLINDYLKDNRNDYIGALRLIPRKILKLYVHSYQSYIFNLSIKEIINKKLINNNEKIPVVGFGSDINDNEIKNIINKILKKERINLRDFIIREIPELSVEGNERDLYMEVMDLKVLEEGEDIKIRFRLKKGCYATVAVDYLFKHSQASLKTSSIGCCAFMFTNFFSLS